MSFNKIVFIVSVLVSLQLSSCMKTYTLLNGITKVPVEKSKYDNKSKFNVNLVSTVDTNVVYEAFNTYKGILSRLDDEANSFYGAYKFYSNGYFNLFILKKHARLNSNMNPEYEGYRGVYYEEDGKIKYDLYSLVNQHQTLGRSSGEFIFKQNRLYIVGPGKNNYNDLYLKRELPEDFIYYKPNW